MFRFRGFDGLRGWLAWTVVIYHATYFSGLLTKFPRFIFLDALGNKSVSIFIILSGFVITHLILEKHEPYLVYLARRALRIYPIYVLALALGFVATFFAFDTFLGPPQSVFVPPPPSNLTKDMLSLNGRGLFEHLFLHLTMLHGIVPSNILFDSQFMFLPPAWSLSLEWQFYVVAPMVVWCASRRWPSILMTLGALASVYLYQRGLFGSFMLPSFLPGASMFFAVGVASRLWIGHTDRRGSPLCLLLIATYFDFPTSPHWPLATWAVFLASSLHEPKVNPIGLAYGKLFGLLFDSRLAKHLGRPSYSTYLVHFPILEFAQNITVRRLHLSEAGGNAFAVLGTIILTYLLSQATYRWVEVPFISLGKRLAKPRSQQM